MAGPEKNREILRRAGVPFLFPLSTLILIVTLFRSNGILAAALFVVASLSLLYRRSRFKACIALYALLLGTGGELACTAARHWTYVNPTFHRLPLWLPLVWPILMVNFFEISAVIADRASAKTWWPVFTAGLILGPAAYLIYVIESLMNSVALIIAVFFFISVIFGRTPVNRVFLVVAGIGGFLGEWACVAAGVWVYPRPGLLSIGMPVSLPLAWGVSANLVWLAARYLPVLGRGSAGDYSAAK